MQLNPIVTNPGVKPMRLADLMAGLYLYLFTGYILMSGMVYIADRVQIYPFWNRLVITVLVEVLTWYCTIRTISWYKKPWSQPSAGG